MSNQNNEQRILTSGLQLGNQANESLTNQITDKAVKMLDQALTDNFQVLLEAKLSQAVQETVSLHTDRAKQQAMQVLNRAKATMANNMIEQQHTYRMAQLAQQDLTLDFDTDLTREVGRLASEAGDITIEVNQDSAIGF
jgi:hypothetical protein